MSDEGALLTGQPCPDCGSSDALAVYSDHTHCFSCGAHKFTDEREPSKLKDKGLIHRGEVRALSARKIHAETCQKFGYSVGEFKGKTVQIAPYYSPTGELVAQKIRFPDKSFVVMGDLKKAGLFGQNLWKAGGKRLVITEGEIDALSYSQVTRLSWPVVSVPNGAQGAKKAIAAQIEYVNSFDEVVLMFDMDEPGQESIKECADLILPGKCLIASLPLKDANEMLKASRADELAKSIYQARVYRPDGVVNGAELWEGVSKVIEMGTPYPWDGLNRLLYGLRPREIVTLTAGAGIGKSSVCAEIAYHLAHNVKQTVGYVALEESVGRTGLRFLGIHENKPLHLPGNDVSKERLRTAFEATLGTGRYVLYDHFGSLDSDNLLGKLRYMVQGCGCQWLVLDHLSIVVSGMDLDGDERRMLDKTMTELRSFTEQTNVGLLLVSHLKRPEGRGHEEGAMTSLAQLRGSAAIGQLSDIVIGLERDQQAEGADRDAMTVRVLKNRYAGITGIACELRYSRETGRVVEMTPTAADFKNTEEENPDF